MNTSVSAALHISAHLYGDITSVFTYLSTTESSQYPSAGSDIESWVQKGGNMWWGAQQVWCGAARYAGELRPNEIRELFLLSFLEVLPPNHLMGSLDQKEMALTPTYFCFENVNLRGPGWPGFERLHFFVFVLSFDAKHVKRNGERNSGFFVRLAHSGWGRQLGTPPSGAPSPPLAEASGLLQVHGFGLIHFWTYLLCPENTWGNCCYPSW